MARRKRCRKPGSSPDYSTSSARSTLSPTPARSTPIQDTSNSPPEERDQESARKHSSFITYEFVTRKRARFQLETDEEIKKEIEGEVEEDFETGYATESDQLTMASSQPSDEDIETLMSMMGSADRKEAIERIRGNNGSVEAAINEFFDNPSSSRYQQVRYDASHWGTDRDGSGGADIPSFNIDSTDDQPHPYQLSNAPTRPPSRTSNRSPNKVIEIPDDANDQNKPLGPTFADQDEDLQRALEMSRQEAGLPPQESGTMDVDQNSRFGPATRDEYESSQWAMVPRAVDNPHQLLFDPEPEYRKREEGKPGFLKPSAANDRLPALLTFYHEIPLAREILLERNKVSPDYGSDPEWWKGNSIVEKPCVDSDGIEEDESERKYRETRNEIQRLMAFLDKSERSYASIDPLTRSAIMQERNKTSDNLAGSFFKILKELHSGSESLKAFLSRGYPDRESAADIDDDTQSGDWFAVLELNLPSSNFASDAELETCYDLADQLLWDGSGETLDDSAFLHDVGEIVAMRFKGIEASRNVHIPTIWYADRYLEENMEAALKMRQQKEEVREVIRKIDIKEGKLQEHTDPETGKTYKVKDLFRTSLLHDVQPGPDGEIPEQSTATGRNADGTMNLSNELRRLWIQIDKKIDKLIAQREKARQDLRDLSKLLTVPSATQPPKHKFTLRGVSPSDTVTYICRKVEANLIEMDIDSVSKDQWWKLEWVKSTHEPVVSIKVDVEEVMKAAESSKDVLVVYASEKAMASPRTSLPEQLEAFVKRDNELFAQELEEGELGEIRRPNITSPRSPPKRKRDEEEGRWLGGTEVPVRNFETDSQPHWGGQASKQDVSHVENSKNDVAHFEHIPSVEPVEMQEREGAPMLGYSSLRSHQTDGASDATLSQETVTHEDLMSFDSMEGVDKGDL